MRKDRHHPVLVHWETSQGDRQLLGWQTLSCSPYTTDDTGGGTVRGTGHWAECAEKIAITKRVMFIITLSYIGQAKQSAKYTRIPTSLGHAHRTVHSDKRSSKQSNNSTRLRVNRSHNVPFQRCFRDAAVWSHINLPPLISIESSHHNSNLFAGCTLSPLHLPLPRHQSSRAWPYNWLRESGGNNPN